ncbi:FAD:protein FMN transferase [Flexistipes sp.]|uniref:FAD:protein FMN transferase n=1 Tax=Flexistipes sp. TaxID=3088135 RepID=UPI002E1CD2BD|nr:FAD:protein FMN transferase [Flexistipes sp.]
MRQVGKGNNLLMDKFAKIITAFLFVLIVSVISGCRDSKQYNTRSFYEMGTIVNITLGSKNDNIINELNRKMKSWEKEVSRFAEKVNNAKSGQSIPVPGIIYNLLQKAEYYKKQSNKKFDITIATISSLYGFPKGPFRIPDNETIQNKSDDVGFSNLVFDKTSLSKKTQLKIDMGAYAKGYIVDKGIEFLKSEGIKSAMINAGGDLYALGNKKNRKWHIAIKNPDNKTKFLSIIALKNKAVATSGNYERFFEKNGKRYTHIFDSTTLQTANNYKSISVIADTVERSDGLATVYYLMDINKIKELCKKEKTPVLVYTLKSKKIKLCGWQGYEISD